MFKQAEPLLLVEFTQTAITRFIAEGQVSQAQLLALYRGDGIRDQYKAIGKEIEALFPTLDDSRDQK